MLRLKGVSFETAIIERYRRRESSVEEALIEMYLAGVSVRRVEDITEALWDWSNRPAGRAVSPATISELNNEILCPHRGLAEPPVACTRRTVSVCLIVGDKCMGMLEAVGEVFPDAKYQRCTVHFYRNVFSVVPKSKVKIVAKMLKAIHAQESKKASREKAKAVVAELRAMKLKEAAKKVEDGIEETLTYCDFPSEHWTRIRTNNVIERLNREIRRRRGW